MKATKPTIFIVDDEPPVRAAVSRLLRAAGLDFAAFASPQEFLAGYDRSSPGCLVLDVAMPGLNGLELQESLAELGSPLPIIFLTGRADIPMSVQAMKRGAIDFLTKPVHDLDLLDAIRRALAKDAETRREGADREDIRLRYESLTPREQEVLRHVVSGQLNKQIAGDLGIVEQTIKVHRARVMEKMRVQSVAELVRLAERMGISREP